MSGMGVQMQRVYDFKQSDLLKEWVDDTHWSDINQAQRAMRNAIKKLNCGSEVCVRVEHNEVFLIKKGSIEDYDRRCNSGRKAVK